MKPVKQSFPKDKPPKSKCAKCGSMVWNDLESQADHMYREHTGLFFGTILNAIPKAREAGQQIAAVIKKAVQS